MTSEQLPRWIVVWFIVASVVVCIDSLYVLGIHYNARALIPSVVQYGWSAYGETDMLYNESGDGIRASNGWMPTQSQFNLLEVAAQIYCLLLHRRSSPATIVVALMVSVAVRTTLSPATIVSFLFDSYADLFSSVPLSIPI